MSSALDGLRRTGTPEEGGPRGQEKGPFGCLCGYPCGHTPMPPWLGVLNFLKRVVGSTELESVTSCVSSRRSNQLSYEPSGSTRGESLPCCEPRPTCLAL